MVGIVTAVIAEAGITGIVATVLEGAAAGAAVGGISAVASGGNILDGIVKGGVTGAVGGAIGGAVSAVAGEISAAAGGLTSTEQAVLDAATKFGTKSLTADALKTFNGALAKTGKTLDANGNIIKGAASTINADGSVTLAAPTTTTGGTNNAVATGLNAAGTLAAAYVAKQAGDIQAEGATGAANILSPAALEAARLQSGAATQSAQTLSDAAIRSADVQSGAATQGAGLQSGAATQGAGLTSAAALRGGELQAGAATQGAGLRSTAALQGADLQAVAAKRAADLRAAGYTEAAAAEIAGAEVAKGDVRSMLAQQTANQQPYMAAGQKALTQLTEGLAPGGQFNKAFTMADAQNMPAYQFALQQGRAAIDAGAAAKGGALSSNAISAGITFAEGTAAQYEQQAFDQWMRQNNLTLGALQNMVQTGQVSVNQLQSALGSAGVSLATIDQNIGISRGAGIRGAAGAQATGTEQAAGYNATGLKDSAGYLATGLTDAAGFTAGAGNKAAGYEAAGLTDAAKYTAGGLTDAAKYTAGGITNAGTATAAGQVGAANATAGGITGSAAAQAAGVTGAAAGKASGLVGEANILTKGASTIGNQYSMDSVLRQIATPGGGAATGSGTISLADGTAGVNPGSVTVDASGNTVTTNPTGTTSTIEGDAGEAAAAANMVDGANTADPNYVPPDVAASPAVIPGASSVGLRNSSRLFADPNALIDPQYGEIPPFDLSM